MQFKYLKRHKKSVLICCQSFAGHLIKTTFKYPVKQTRLLCRFSTKLFTWFLALNTSKDAKIKQPVLQTESDLTANR